MSEPRTTEVIYGVVDSAASRLSSPPGVARRHGHSTAVARAHGQLRANQMSSAHTTT